MEGTIHTLQEYMLHTESITYILIVAALIGITFFFRFLTDRDDDEEWKRIAECGMEEGKIAGFKFPLFYRWLKYGLTYWMNGVILDLKE